MTRGGRPNRLYRIAERAEQDSDAETSNIFAENAGVRERVFVRQLRKLYRELATQTNLYERPRCTLEESRQRVAYLKDVIENKGGHRMFYINGKPLRREQDVQIMFRLVWYGTLSDISREVNDGRGPADFKISRGASDKTIIEFKLAKNKQLERNLRAQTEIYQRASDARGRLEVVVYFSEKELHRVLSILERLGLVGHPDIVLIDARACNKPSASKALPNPTRCYGGRRSLTRPPQPRR